MKSEIIIRDMHNEDEVFVGSCLTTDTEAERVREAQQQLVPGG